MGIEFEVEKQKKWFFIICTAVVIFDQESVELWSIKGHFGALINPYLS